MIFGICAAIVVILACLYCFAVAPKKAGAAQKAPFMGLMAAHRGLYEKDQSIPENTLEAFRRAAGLSLAIGRAFTFTFIDPLRPSF